MRRAFSFALISSLLLSEARAHEPTFGRKAMVVTQEPIAADVGLDVLKSGGNSIDAAIAVGFALAVTYPYAGNIGGGGFMLIRLANGSTTFIDFREKAPQRAWHDMYLDASGNKTNSTSGWRSIGVPGTVRGFEKAHRYGTKPWRDLLQPAIRLANNGFPISYWQMYSFRNATNLTNCAESKHIFLKDGAFYGWQETFRQPELGRTLDRIARLGADDFYEGDTANMIATEMASHGGLITRNDLHAYQAAERKPLEGDYKGYHIITAPPPSSGGICILQMLGMLNGTGYETNGAGSAASYHYLAEVMKRSFADRMQYLGDPDFMTNPVSALLNPEYLKARRASISPTRSTYAGQIKPGVFQSSEETETTHFSIVDDQGNAVAVTYTLNFGYGSGVTVRDAGFLLNDEMDDFATKPGSQDGFGIVQGEKNAIEPGKRPLSSMSPTIVLKDNKPFLVLGAPGGPAIINAVLQVIVNVIDFHMGVQDAVDFPRIHQLWNPNAEKDYLRLERGVSPDTIARLQAMGHRIEGNAEPIVVARVEAIQINTNGWIEGAHDERGIGKAAGY